ncbi:MAG: S-adenosylmethionine:tRNA ribosyltransferase-isomerase [Rikenellaceae bacterium]
MLDNTSRNIDMCDYDYPLPEERIAKYPLANRTDSKLLHFRNGTIAEHTFPTIAELLPEGTLLVFNNTKVIRARIIMHKSSGARLEIFCLEPHSPADYERAFAVRGECEWSCIVGNLKRWKEGELSIEFSHEGEKLRLAAEMVERGSREHIVRFRWESDHTFGEMLEMLGRIPIPPYLCRESESIDESRYQTVYSKFEGSVAAPTAGLHFSSELIDEMKSRGIETEEVTLHVGAGTFLPVKEENAANHPMHTEHFEITRQTLQRLRNHTDRITAVGTTSVRTLESLAALANRVETTGSAECERVVGQWELYDIKESMKGAHIFETLLDYMDRESLSRLKASTQIMITPLGYRFRVVRSIVTNFHQPKSTLLLLVSAYVGEAWHEIYNYALSNDFRFLSYGDSSLLEMVSDDETPSR